MVSDPGSALGGGGGGGVPRRRVAKMDRPASVDATGPELEAAEEDEAVMMRVVDAPWLGVEDIWSGARYRIVSAWTRYNGN